VAQQGQVAVGGSAGDQIQHPEVLQPGKPGDQAAIKGTPLLQGVAQLCGQGQRGRLLVGRGVGQELQAALEPGHKAMVQGRVAEQRQQGGRQPQGQVRGLGRIGGGRFEHRQQGQIALLQGLEVPVFLQ